MAHQGALLHTLPPIPITVHASTNIANIYMLTLIFGMFVCKGMVNRSLDLCLIAKETTGDCEHGFVFKHIKYFTSYISKLSTLQVAVL